MKASPRFRALIEAPSRNETIIPVVQANLWDPSFRGFTVNVQGFVKRPPDGWFHPSTHPRWAERLLYYYLKLGDQLVPAPFDPHSTMAVTQGNFWHEFLGKVLLDSGKLTALEVAVSDEETRARGHMDGITDEGEVFEFKTMNDRKLGGIADGPSDDPEVIASFRAKCPDYYYQGQEYLRLSGRDRWRGLILSLSYPFEMREVVMGVDRVVQHEIRDKYRNVRQAIADGLERPPSPCCSPRSKESKQCFARSVCPVAQM